MKNIQHTKKKISAIVIARNEEKMIIDCLDSVKWADEVVVVDNGSKDETAEISRKKGAKVFSYGNEAGISSFAELRNFALQKAQGEWVLFVDADERVTPALRKEIIASVEKGLFEAYAIPRRNVLLGHKMRYGGWWPDYVLRLIRKDALKGYAGELHEQPRVDGSIGHMSSPFLHITHRSISEMIEKTNKWSEIEAKLMYDANHPKMNVFRFFSAAMREFWYRAIVKLGFLDGTIGVIEIMYQVYSRLISYTKLWEMQMKSNK